VVGKSGGRRRKTGKLTTNTWSVAIVTFYLPLAAVVIYLNRLMPLEGGLYQWAKLAFNDLSPSWSREPLDFWILVLSGIGLIITTNLSYAIGPPADGCAAASGS